MTGVMDNPSSFWLAKAAIAKRFANRKPPVDLDTRDQLCLIWRGLYLSSCHLEAQKDLLKRTGVTHVLQVGKELSPTHPASFTYKHVPVYDLEEEDLVRYFPECFEFINDGREAGAVLVHCAAGVSRSASVVIGYLMATGALSLEDARSAVKASRPAINPNQGFLLQLQLFQEAGCSAEGWQPWDLERFLRVRSAAISRSDARSSLEAASVENTGSLMRGACELAPPMLSREDSISPTGSPSQSPERSGGSQGPLFMTAGRSRTSTTTTSNAAAEEASVCAAGFGCDPDAQWAATRPALGMLTVRPAADGCGGGPGGIPGLAHCLPALPFVGAPAAGAAAAGPAATWAAIVTANDSGVAGARWRPVAPPAATAPADQAASDASAPPQWLTPSCSLQRQRSAGDAVVATALAAGRPAAQLLSSIGASAAAATAAGALVSTTAPGSFPTAFIFTGGTYTAEQGSVIPAATQRLGDGTGLRADTGAGLGPVDIGTGPPRARTTSGIADASAVAAWRATCGSLSAWPPQPPQGQPFDVLGAQAWPAAAAQAAGSGAVAKFASPGAVAEVAPVAKPAPWGEWPHDGRDWSHGRDSARDGGPDGVARMRGRGRASYSGGRTSADPLAAGVILPDPRANWPAASGPPQGVPPPPPPPPTSQPPPLREHRDRQPTFDAVAPTALSPIPSDGGCSDDACKSEADDDARGGGGGVGRFGGSAQQLRPEEGPGEAAAPLRGTGRRGVLRRSLSDRLQGVLTTALPGLAATLGVNAGAEGGGEAVAAVGSSRPIALSDGAATAGGDHGTELAAGHTGRVGGGDETTEGVGRPYAIAPAAPPGAWLLGSLGPVAAAAVHVAAPRLSTDSGASSAVLAPVWPDGSGSDGSSNSSSTTTSQASAAEGPLSGGGGCAAEERSDATSGVAGGGGLACPHGGLAPGGGGDGGGTTPTSGARVSASPVSPGDVPRAWALGHNQRWALVPVLTPAGLERTPSKVPQAPPASASAADAVGSAGAGPVAVVDAAVGLGLPMGWPGALSASEAQGGDCDVGGAAARSVALSHLVAANALSQGAAAAVAAVATAAAHVRSDAEITASRTPSVGGAAASPRGAQPVTNAADAFKLGPQRDHVDAGVASGAASNAQLSGGRAVAAAGSGCGGPKAASRLATATFAHPDGGSDGLESGGGRREYSREYSVSSIVASVRASVGAAAATASYDEGDGDFGSPSDTDTEPPYSLQRCSAPSAMMSGLLASADGMAAEAALPPADSVLSPPPAVTAPARPLRLSIRNLHGPSQGGSGVDAAAAVTGPHDVNRPDGGAGTPIHKRVLRSLTTFLSRSPESPTASTAGAGAGTTTTAQEDHGDESGGDGASTRGAGPPPIGRAAAGAGAGTAAGGAGGLGPQRNLWTGGTFDAVVGNDEAAGMPGQAAQSRSLTAGEPSYGTAVRAAVLLPPAASSMPGGATHAPPAPQQPPEGWPAPFQAGGVDGSDDVTVGSAVHSGCADSGSSAPGDFGIGRVLFRSRSCSPTCAVAAAGGPFAWPSDSQRAASTSVSAGTERREPGPAAAAAVMVTGTGARLEAGPATGAASADAQRASYNAPGGWGEEAGEEEVVGLDGLPDAPFRWGPAIGGAEWQPGHAAEPFSGGAAAAAAAVGTNDAVVAQIGAALAAAGAPALHRGNSRHFSLDGRRNDVDGLLDVRLANKNASAAAATAKAAACTYLASLASVASAVLLPAPSDVVELEGTPPNLAAAAPPAVAATTSAPATDAVAIAAAWWQAPAAASSGGGGGACGMQRASSAGPPALTLPSVSAAAQHARRSDGLALLGSGGGGADTMDPGSAAARQAQESAGRSNPTIGAGSGADADTAAHARRPRSSYSGALSMLASMGRHGIEAWPGAGVGAAAAGASSQWRPHLPSADPQPPAHPLPLSRASHGALGPAPLSSPVLNLPPLSALAEPPPSNAGPGSQDQQPGAAAAVAGVRLAMPAWGGSRSSACLMTMPSDPEPPTPEHEARPEHPQEAQGAGPHPLPPSQQALLLRQRLNGPEPTAQGGLPPGRATVRSSSTGSSAAAHAAAAGSFTADSSWGHLRAARKQHHHHQHHHHQHLQQQQSPVTVPLPRMSGPADAADPWVGAPAWSRSAVTLPLLESPSGPLSAAPPPTAPAAAASSPAIASASAVPAAAPLASPSISPSSAAGAVMGLHISLSPAASSGGSSASVQSPRAPPAVSDLAELDPLSELDWLDGSPDATAAAAAAAVPPPVTRWRASDAAAAAVPAGASPGRPDPSLLKPVLGRRLLPMPSPSRILVGSPAGTPRGSAGGAACAPTLPSKAGPLQPAHPQQQPAGATSMVPPEAAAANLAVPSAGPAGPAPRPAINVTDLRVLLPHELKAAGGGAAGGSLAVASTAASTAGAPVSLGGTAAPPPPSGRCSSGGGARDWERPAGSPGAWPGQDVRSPSAMCGSQSNSDDGGPGSATL